MNPKESLFVSLMIMLEALLIAYGFYEINGLQLRVSFMEARHAKEHKK